MKYQQVFLDALGFELAPEVVSSTELEERLAPLYAALRIHPGQLEAMTGIQERRYWEPDFPLHLGAARAAEHALSRSQVRAEDLEVLIYAGVCREGFEPATACHVAAALQDAGHYIHPEAAVYDLSNACLAMLNGMLDIANRIELGQIRAGMVVSCESAREIVDTMINRMLRERDMEIFKSALATLTGGSGAAAIILSDGSFAAERQPRLLGGVQMNDPRHHLLCRWGMEPQPGPRPTDGDPQFREYMHTDSVGVLEHGVALGKRTWEAFLAEMAWNGVDRTVCHQVGSAHRDTILEMIGVPKEHDFVAYDFLGNTGTCALPVALALASDREFLRPGHKVGLCGIGSGLNCMMLGVEW